MTVQTKGPRFACIGTMIWVGGLVSHVDKACLIYTVILFINSALFILFSANLNFKAMSKTYSFVLKVQGRSILIKKVVYCSGKRTKHIAIEHGVPTVITAKRYAKALSMCNA